MSYPDAETCQGDAKTDWSKELSHYWETEQLQQVQSSCYAEQNTEQIKFGLQWISIGIRSPIFSKLWPHPPTNWNNLGVVWKHQYSSFSKSKFGRYRSPINSPKYWRRTGSDDVRRSSPGQLCWYFCLSWDTAQWPSYTFWIYTNSSYIFCIHDNIAICNYNSTWFE